jgi:hypothetical protein
MRNCAGFGIVEYLEVGAVADFWRDAAGEVVGSEGQGSESREAGYLGRDRAGEVERREVQERDPGLALPCSASDPGPATRAGVLVARIVLSPIGSQVWATTLPGEEDRFVLAQSTIVLECQQLCSEAIHVLQISHSTWKPRRGRPTCMHHSKTLQSRSKKRIDTAIFSALLST